MKLTWKLLTIAALVLIAVIGSIIYVQNSQIPSRPGVAAVSGPGNTADDIDSIANQITLEADSEIAIIQSESATTTNDNEALNNFDNVYDANQY